MELDLLLLVGGQTAIGIGTCRAIDPRMPGLANVDFDFHRRALVVRADLNGSDPQRMVRTGHHRGFASNDATALDAPKAYSRCGLFGETGSVYIAFVYEKFSPRLGQYHFAFPLLDSQRIISRSRKVIPEHRIGKRSFDGQKALLNDGSFDVFHRPCNGLFHLRKISRVLTKSLSPVLRYIGDTMFKFLVGLIKLKLALLFVVLVIYLLTFPPEQRSGQLRQVGVETLGGIEDLAGMGREALSDRAADFETVGDKENGALVFYRTKSRHLPTLLPDDFRRELAESVKRLDAVGVTERWQAIEYSAIANSRDPDLR